jgi:hypothetical protein
MTLPDTGTMLVMDGVGIPLYSARGLTIALKPIQASKNLRRTVDGELRNTSYAQFRKYAISISSKDQQPPALDGVFPGDPVVLWLPKYFSYPVGGSPARQVVCGSENNDDPGFVRYLPILYCLIVDWSDNLDEWTADQPWQIDFEEQ